MVQIPLEDDQIRMGKVQKEIGRLCVEVPLLDVA